jgi:hypothetical protein
MTRRDVPSPQVEDEDEELPERGALESVISSHGAFRALLILLSIWTFFEGFALTTGILDPVDVGTDRTAERMLGGLMLVLAGVYATIAWRREQYRLLLWVPFAAQVAIVVPLLFALPGGELLLVISSIFLALMLYVWWQSRDIELASDDDEEDDDEFDDEQADDEADAPAPVEPESVRRQGRFRRRDA